MFKLTRIEKFWLIAGIVCCLIGIGIANAQASTSNGVVGGEFVASDESVTITCLKKDAAYKSMLFIEVDGTEQFLFWSRQTGRVKTIRVNPGSQIVFKLFVENTGEIFFSGDMSRNPDGIEHVESVHLGGNSYQFGFEDQLNGGDFDFNDCMFQIDGVYVDGGYDTESAISSMNGFRPNENDCSREYVDYIDVDWVTLAALDRGERFDVLRIVVTSDQIDWTLFHNGQITVEVTLNDRCDLTFRGTDEIRYFEIPEKRFKGYRLSDYDYPEAESEYAGKIRVTEERGKMMHYIYFNNVPSTILDMARTGDYIVAKIRLYQDGNLIQAYLANGKSMDYIQKY